MRALRLHAVGDLRYESIPTPEPQAGEALVRVAAAGVCGSDVARVFVHGTYRYPLVPGHEFSGTVVEACGSEQRVGQRVTAIPLIPCHSCVFCQIGAYAQCQAYDYLGSRRDGGFAEYVRVPQTNLLPVPDETDLVSAALTEPAAVALHALRQAMPEPGETVAILGCGPIGVMLAQWARTAGAGAVLLIDIDKRKLAVAQQLGFEATCNSADVDPVSWVMQATCGRGADIVVEAAGVPATFEQGIRMVRAQGRLVLMGNPSQDVLLPQETVSQILRKQLTIRGTWNSSFSELPLNEWRVTLEMVSRGKLDLLALVSHQLPLCDGIAALRMLRAGREFHERVVLINDSEKGV